MSFARGSSCSESQSKVPVESSDERSTPTPQMKFSGASSSVSHTNNNNVSHTFALTGLLSTGFALWNAAIPKHYGWANKKKRATGSIESSLSQRIVFSAAFKYGTNLTILLSAIQMGMAADIHTNTWDDVFNVCDHAFTIIFVAEMLLKLKAFGISYFTDAWNVLDFVVVVASVLDVWVLPIVVGKDADTLQTLKMFRLLRLLRIVRMLRIVPELMLVVEGIFRSLRSMFWVFLLLAVMLYTVGIYCVDQIGSEGAGYPARDADFDVLQAQSVQNFNSFLYFGTVSRSMVSLFGLVLLSEWGDIVRPVWQQQPGIVFVFIMLVILTTFGVLNVIIGVVVERTTDVMKQVQLKDVARKKREQIEAFQLISTLMFDLDTNNDRRISEEEMIQGAKNDKLHDLLEKVDMPHGFTYGELHAMLDQDGTGLLSRTEFINGMLRLVYNDDFQRDCMFQLSMGQIKANQRKLHRELSNDMRHLFTQLTKELNVLRRQIKAIAESNGVDVGDTTEDFKGDLDLRSEFTRGDGSASPSLLINRPSSSIDLVPSSVNSAIGKHVSLPDTPRQGGDSTHANILGVTLGDLEEILRRDLPGQSFEDRIPTEDGTAFPVHQLQVSGLLISEKAKLEERKTRALPNQSCTAHADHVSLTVQSRSCHQHEHVTFSAPNTPTDAVRHKGSALSAI